jgi:hypothetical protein
LKNFLFWVRKLAVVKTTIVKLEKDCQALNAVVLNIYKVKLEKEKIEKVKLAQHNSALEKQIEEVRNF